MINAWQVNVRFNPCFNGFFFSIHIQLMKLNPLEGFNPCFNGFFFSIPQLAALNLPCVVSILVLMDSSFQFKKALCKERKEKGFNPCFNGFFFSISPRHAASHLPICFNPCFNGFFFSICDAMSDGMNLEVSILVLMDSSFQFIDM